MDDEIEKLLRGYRPAAPSPALRDAIVSRPGARGLNHPGARGFSRAAEWLPAAAALILAVVFYWMAGVERQHLEARLFPIPPIDQMTDGFEEPQP